MIYTEFQGKQLSMLGFGTMRLPTLADGEIDRDEVARMTAVAMENGVNYFDTAYPYHGGLSEIVIGDILKQYPRESYYLATKYPGHQIVESYDPATVFEHQLRKCGVEHFDFYLLHNVYESSLEVYLDPRWGILDYFREQKRLGRIKHLGFSTHARTETLRAFLDVAGEDMEFCQIQLNWMDWSLQDARGKVALLNERGIPVWVMEPVRGGKLCHLSPENEARLRAERPEESIPAWGFRFLQDIPGVKMILSGMSNMEQMLDNLATFRSQKPLSDAERALLLEMAEGMKDSVPCTACRYCTSECPMGLDIPMMLETYNDLRFAPITNSAMRLEFLPPEKQPSACIGCGACARMCPQGIQIPEILADLSRMLERIPKWGEICRQREEEALRLLNS